MEEGCRRQSVVQLFVDCVADQSVCSHDGHLPGDSVQPISVATQRSIDALLDAHNAHLGRWHATCLACMNCMRQEAGRRDEPHAVALDTSLCRAVRAVSKTVQRQL